MNDRSRVEKTHGWVATLKRTNRKARDKYLCLCRSLGGSFYWHTPDYKGLFAWGACREVANGEIIENLCNGNYIVVKGVVPKVALRSKTSPRKSAKVKV